MKEEGDWSSEGHSSTTSEDRAIIPEWAELLPELVARIADHVLSTTGGVDAYMDMRAVCPSWRSAIIKPSPLAAVADPRFRPRHWVMLDLRTHRDDPRLFLHVPTGRFRRLILPVVRDHVIAGISDGLLVLGERYPSPFTAHVFNPFTGDMLHFAAKLPEKVHNNAAYTSVNGVVLLSRGKVLCAAPTSDVFTEKSITEEDVDTELISIINFQGNVYCANMDGCVFRHVVARTEDQCDDDELVLIAEVWPHVGMYNYTAGETASNVVESAGELLLVRYVDPILKVFRVNVALELEHEYLEEVNSLGGRTLFLGEHRCVSVDADKLPSVDGDCIYMIFSEFRDIRVYNIRGDMVDIISSDAFRDSVQPFSLVQLLLRYCQFHSQHL